MEKLYGSSVSGGVALGQVLLWDKTLPELDTAQLSREQAAPALERYVLAKQQVRLQLEARLARLDEQDPARQTVRSQLDVVDNEALDELIRSEIAVRLVPPDRAVHTIGHQYVQRLQKSSDPLWRERAAYLTRVVNRFLRAYAGAEVPDLSDLPGPRVIVAHELTAKDLAGLDKANVLAFVTELGASSSHAAIIARDHGIPAVMGVRRALENLRNGETVLVDASSGSVLTSPTAATLEWYAQEKDRLEKHRAAEADYAVRAACTRDGVRVYIGLNIGSGAKDELEAAPMVDCVGMMRTEFLFMNASAPPPEEQQYEYYRRVAERFRGKSVTLRVADLGGEKEPVWLAAFREDNERADKRGLRLMLDNPGLLLPQLRAALRAAAHGNVRIMFPMVVGIDDYRGALDMLERAKAGLQAERAIFEKDVPCGVLIETPAAAILADGFAREVDFASVGTNDLTQYLLAADRMDPNLELYYQPLHPAVFRLVDGINKAFTEAGKPLSVCGEVAGDLRAAPVLVGLGLRELSVSPIALGPLKRRLAAQSVLEMEQLAANVIKMRRTHEVVRRLEEEMETRV